MKEKNEQLAEFLLEDCKQYYPSVGIAQEVAEILCREGEDSPLCVDSGAPLMSVFYQLSHTARKKGNEAVKKAAEIVVFDPNVASCIEKNGSDVAGDIAVSFCFLAEEEFQTEISAFAEFLSTFDDKEMSLKLSGLIGGHGLLKKGHPISESIKKAKEDLEKFCEEAKKILPHA